ncbi:MAG: HYR domain-containing protein [Saprospiraceae bacterium]|nr:HYR domain-containing protein [Saprospiraceae bacterium]
MKLPRHYVLPLFLLSSWFFLNSNQTIAQSSESKFASSWSDPNPPNWTPQPNNGNVLGPPDGNCTGTSNAGTIEAIFNFPAFSVIAPIVGVEVVVRYGSVVSPTLQLRNSGSEVGSTRVLPNTPSTGSCNESVARTAGADNDLWGTTLTAADFNAGTVGVRLTRVTGLDNPISIDIESVELIVYYTGGNSDPDCSGANIANQGANSNCQATISGSDVMGITDPDGDPLTIMVSPSTLVLGANMVMVSADDGNGGTCNQTINVNVVDQTDPVISCPSSVNRNNDPGQCSAVVNFIVSATDNCSVANISCTPSSGSVFPVGTTAVNCTVTDGSGNTDECSFNVTVLDTEDPQIDCSAINANRTTDPGLCSFTMPGTGFNPTFSDNCLGTSISNDYNNLSSLAGATFPKGTTSVKWTATDAAGNSSQCTIEVVIIDVEDPEIDCSAINPNRTTDPGLCSFTMPGTGFDPSFSDNCPGVSILNDYNNAGTLAGATFPEGTTPVIWTATDAAGNTSQCSIDVVIVDDEAPVINTIADPITLWPPNHKYQSISAAQCVISVTDNCDMDLTADDVFITQVTSDEPEDLTGGGDGNTSEDIVISGDCKSVDLRSERQGGGNGRVYTLHLSVLDYTGNEGTAICQVTVAHNKKDVAVDDGVSYSVTGCVLPKLAGPVFNLTDKRTEPTYVLGHNYPNPFSFSTRITINLEEVNDVSLSIYDLQGQLVRTLQSGKLTAGSHNFDWSGTNTNGEPVASGVYIYQLRGPDFVRSHKLMYLPR